MDLIASADTRRMDLLAGKLSLFNRGLKGAPYRNDDGDLTAIMP